MSRELGERGGRGTYTFGSAEDDSVDTLDLDESNLAEGCKVTASAL